MTQKSSLRKKATRIYSVDGFSDRIAGKRKKKKNRYVIYPVIFVLLVIFIVAGFRSSYVSIKDISVAGTRVENAEKVKEVIENNLIGSYAFVLPKNNILLYPRNAIEDALRESFPRFDGAEIRADSATGIAVFVTERHPSFIWCKTDTQCMYTDKNGVAYSRAPMFSGNLFFEFSGTEGNDVPIVEGRQVRFLSEDRWKIAIDIHDFMEQIFADKFSSAGIPRKINLLSADKWEVEIADGKDRWKIVLSPASFSEKTKQDINLAVAYILNEQTQKGLPDLQYIDFRFGNRVVYKYSE